MPIGIEIERKFVVEHLPPDLADHPSDPIEQGYIVVTDDGLEVRLRQYGERRLLTIKSAGERARVEEEIEIDRRRFESLWPLTEDRRIEKTRYRVPAEDGLTIELDVYDGRLKGLITAEVEFDSDEQAEAFTAPEWLGREVTEDPAYKNKRLATGRRPER